MRCSVDYFSVRKIKFNTPKRFFLRSGSSKNISTLGILAKALTGRAVVEDIKLFCCFCGETLSEVGLTVSEGILVTEP